MNKPREEKREMPKFMVGSNGYYFVDDHHVDKEEFEKQFDRWQVSLMNQKLDKLLKESNE